MPVKKSTKKPTTKKRAVKKTAPAKKTATKKAAGKKSTPRKPTAKKASKKSAPARRTYKATEGVDFRDGSDAKVVWEYVQTGGGSRAEVIEKLHDYFGNQTTPNGNRKPVSTVANQVIRRALATGDYVIESHWRVAPVNGGAPAATKAKATTKKATRKGEAGHTPKARKASKPSTKKSLLRRKGK